MNKLENKVHISADVNEALNNYLTMVDHYLPGKINGFYIVGSIALNDYHPRKSDIDFVSVSNEHFSKEELVIVSNVHTKIRKMKKYPKFDGIYVTWNELKLSAENISVPFCLGNKFKKSKGFAANPVTWHMLAQYPLSIRGPEKPSVYSNVTELRNWCKSNLNTYWKRWVNNAKRDPLKILYSFSPLAITWGVLGVVRLHATITTGGIISKSKASEYALNSFPKEWEKIIHIALLARINTNQLFFNPFIHNPLIQRKRALQFMEYVINDANKIEIPIH